MLSLARAIELVGRLSRTKFYPFDDETGVENLARGLQHAESKSGVGAGRIIEACLEISEYCPPDSEILQVAMGIARADAVVAGTYDSTSGMGNSAPLNQSKEWEREYGKPTLFQMDAIDMDRTRQVKLREKALYSAIRKAHPEELDWQGMAAAAEELGYPDYAKAWRRGMVGGDK